MFDLAQVKGAVSLRWPLRHDRESAGFTLIEVMVTLVILSVAILALAKLQISAIRGNILSQNMTTAVALAEKKIEELKTTPYANIAAASATTVTAGNRNFTQQVTVTLTTLAE